MMPRNSGHSEIISCYYYFPILKVKKLFVFLQEVRNGPFALPNLDPQQTYRDMEEWK